MDITDIAQILDLFSASRKNLHAVVFAGKYPSPPLLAHQVHFQRIEIVVSGELPMLVGSDNQSGQEMVMTQGDVLVLPGDSWNKSDWKGPAASLSILVGKQNFGLSYLAWNGSSFDRPLKENILRRGPRTGTFILQALEELKGHPQDQETARQLVCSLLTHMLDLKRNPPATLSKSKALFEAVREYIEQHYQEPLTRESVAAHFYISPNYLSQLFQKEGPLKFNEHLNHIRLERSKQLLKEYDMKVKEVAHQCGFSDSNYFCRLFRQQTARSPSEYRTQYRSSFSGN
ncbi:helix-turn-helix transcriptional regulator [Aeromonas jandaei]